MAKLNARQKRFVEEYLVDLNASAAARRAGYSLKTADVSGHENLKKPEIAEAIALAQKKRSEKTRITAERVLEELARIGFSDPRKLFDAQGTLKPIAEWEEDSARAIASIETLEVFEGSGDSRTIVGHTKKVKLWDKVSALEKIARHLGMFIDRVKLEGGVQVEVTELVCRSRAEAKKAVSLVEQAG